MAKQKGRSYIVKFNNGTSLVTLAGQDGLTFSVNNEIVDITTKDDEVTSGANSGALYRKLGETFGMTSCTLTVTGKFTASADEAIFLADAMANDHVALTVTIPGADTASDVLSGTFAYASYEIVGGTVDAVTYSITMESAGEVTIG